MTKGDPKERTYRVLEAIILSYAESGTPVGSEFLRERFGFEVSPATIRNVMAELEEKGLITHPHTSAGRVPTDLGYRYYVDLLMERKRLRPDEEERIGGLARWSGADPEGLLEEGLEALAELARETGVALVPQLAHGSLGQIRLIPTGVREAVGVLITREGWVKHARVELARPLGLEDLEGMERWLNAELDGLGLGEAWAHLRQELLGASEEPSRTWRGQVGLESLDGLFQEEPTVMVQGTSWVLQAPEFRDPERTRRLLQGLDNREELGEILERDLWADGVKVHIGSENRGTSLTDCAIVAAPYRLAGGMVGAIGVLGPTRMNYPRVTGLVRRMAQAISETLQGR